MNDLTIAEPIAADAIRSRIFTIRGAQVMLAPDLADLYQVETRSFNQSVKRNLKRFPDNFRFQLTKAELEEVITKCDNPDRLRFSPQLPFAFTEQGIAMLSGVLNSDIAIQVSIRIMNTFGAEKRRCHSSPCGNSAATIGTTANAATAAASIILTTVFSFPIDLSLIANPPPRDKLSTTAATH